MMKILFLVFATSFLLCVNVSTQAQKPIYAANTTKEARAGEYKYLVNNSIGTNILLPLTDSTEENWQDAFDAMLLLNYRTRFIDARIHSAMDSVEYRSLAFQKVILQLIYSLYPNNFVLQVAQLLKQTNDPKLFAMCSEYLFLNNKKENYRQELLQRMEDIGRQFNDQQGNPFFSILNNKIRGNIAERPPLQDMLGNTFLTNEMVVYSFQRKNRNYPGLVMVRNKDGQFIKEIGGKYFAVPQLARSNSNMPGYLSNGNTPQGIFKIFGFAVSQGSFIGPTTNIQMVLPYENSTDVSDSVTRSLGDNYRFLLPNSWKSYYPIYEAYYAGKAGRTEIIAHGTTVNPAYYAKQPYYPLTPTQGCLCTKEIWSAVDGKRMQSDQQKLVEAVKKAGGGNGYCVVIEIDDQQKPVSIIDILPFLNKK